jgi:hypothetical protein
MQLQNLNIETVLTLVALLGGLIAWMWSRLDKRFDSIMSELREMKTDISKIQVQMGKIQQKEDDEFKADLKLILQENKKNK